MLSGLVSEPPLAPTPALYEPISDPETPGLLTSHLPDEEVDPAAP